MKAGLTWPCPLSRKYSPGWYISEGISQQAEISWGGITQFDVHYQSIFLCYQTNNRDNVSEEGII